MNKGAIEGFGLLLSTMGVEAAKRDAPVNMIHRITMGDPFRALVFALLSSRTRDEATMAAAERLLAVAPTAYRLAGMHEEEIEHLVSNVAFYRAKAKNLKKMATILVLQYNAMVPERMDELVKFPGVGRKTANVVLTDIFNKDAIAVDTHVHRISNRLGIVKTKKPEWTEKKLMAVIPKKYWARINRAFVAYGQTVCLPRNPDCDSCRIKKFCMCIGVR